MTQAAVIVFRNVGNKYEFLLLKRLPEFGGFWQYVGGKVETGENILEAAFREVYEETGIIKDNILRVVEDVHYFTMDKHYLTNEPVPLIEEFVYAFEVGSDVKININNNPDSEHEKYKWVSFDAALKMFKWDNNKDAFEKLRKILKI